MAAKSLKLYLFSLLATLALGGLAYQAGLFDRGSEKDEAVSTAPAPAADAPVATAENDEPAASASDDTSRPAEAEVTEASEAPPASDPPTAAVMSPRFDVVRVQPDGNVVIAGSSAGSAMVEVITGKRVLGQGEAGAEGDFVVVLDEALDAGNYMIVLRSTAPDGTVAMSAETAIVSVPEGESGEVLAIVDEPGKPSKLITIPEAAERGATAAETVVAEETSAELDSADASGSSTPPAADTTSPVDEIIAESEELEEAELADAGAPEEDGSATAETAATSERQQAGESVAAADPAPVVKPNEPSIVVEAVEIEGNYVYVAGRAEAGKIVRVYANKDLIGETEVSEGGRFLVESARGLAVGDYIIRADLLGLGSADVLARAAVPFEREPGEAVAAVAPGLGMPGRVAPTEAVTQVAEAKGAEDQPGSGAGETVPRRIVAEPAPAQAEREADTVDVLPMPQPAQQPDEGAQEHALPDAQPRAGSPDASRETAPAPVAGNTPDADQPEPAAGPVAPGRTEDRAPVGISESPAAPPAGQAETVVDEPAIPADPSKERDAPAADAPAPATGEDEDIAITAPALEPAAGSVIIRRGDTLWRISRRVYGRGVRYSTIYDANRDQIADPDWIWPGQVFDVPGVSDDGAAANLGAIADRLQEKPDN